MALKFSFTIEDDESGEVLASDFTTFEAESIGDVGQVETIDIHTGTALRAVKRDLARHAAMLEANAIEAAQDSV
jgi:hypothetical protein